MKSLNDWLDEYAQNHKNKTNQIIHKVCVPAIEFSILGILWLLPTPEIFWNIPYLNWATIFCSLSLIFYISLGSILYLVGSLLMLMPMLLIIHFLKESFGGVVIYSYFLIFVIAWIGQFIGHKIEGQKPSFFKDLLFLLIGPLWVLKSIFKKIGLKTT
ncbi:hypothetical protein BIY24_05240 [Halobacteriovorax marinus]|uniref:Mpo1 family 2-hydroxy fatty acid dioxygenase n=1 Tax=Halobacteriovorax marinus TaxID=97084 RepID=UPI000BC2C64F|nr:Mpo1-like protein [Halobacteriovorax marinus]ATH07361.1 hypothetical protein BIY24_05240 [Halobacteriovorax marinus]